MLVRCKQCATGAWRSYTLVLISARGCGAHQTKGRWYVIVIVGYINTAWLHRDEETRITVVH